MHGVGAQSLLDLPITAFFASRQCPGVAIRAAMDWVLQQAKAGQVVVSGFHSPLEQSAKLLPCAMHKWRNWPPASWWHTPAQAAAWRPWWRSGCKKSAESRCFSASRRRRKMQFSTGTWPVSLSLAPDNETQKGEKLFTFNSLATTSLSFFSKR